MFDNAIRGWQEAAKAWRICASTHAAYCKKDPFFTTRQSDFQKHAEDAWVIVEELEANLSEPKVVAWEFPKRYGSGLSYPKPEPYIDEDGNLIEPSPLYRHSIDTPRLIQENEYLRCEVDRLTAIIEATHKEK